MEKKGFLEKNVKSDKIQPTWTACVSHSVRSAFTVYANSKLGKSYIAQTKVVKFNYSQ